MDINLFILGQYLGAELLDYQYDVIFSFLRNCQTFSKVVAIFYIPTSNIVPFSSQPCQQLVWSKDVICVWHFCILFGKVSVWIFFQFLMSILILLWRVLFIFWIQFLCLIYNLDIPLLICNWPFHSLNSVFQIEEVSFDEVQFINFFNNGLCYWFHT